MSEWIRTTLGNFSPLSYGKSLPERDRRGTGGVVVYGSNGPVGKHDKALVHEPGVIVGRKGSVGEVHFSSSSFWSIDTTFYAVGSLENDVRFTYYLLKGLDLRGMNSDSAIPGLNRDAVHSLGITVPRIKEQRAIAEVLGALDDKIESNQRIAENILKFADVIYEDAMESGSTQVAVADVARFHNNERMPLSAQQRRDMPGKIPYYGATGVVDHVGQHLFDRVHVLVGEDGTVFTEDGAPITQYVWGRYWVNNHAHVLSGVGMSTETLLISLRRLDVRSGVTGAVQLKLNMGNLRSLMLMVPLQDDIHRIEVEYEHLFARYRTAKDETSTLTALRDSLLPELLSGRSRILEAAEFVGSV